MNKHVAVWIDHKEARVFTIAPESTAETTVLAPSRHVHSGSSGQEGIKDNAEGFKRFFQEVEAAIVASEEILIVGPGSAKLEFFKYVQQHDAALAHRVVGIETVDHPTDAQIVAHAKTCFSVGARPVHAVSAP